MTLRSTANNILYSIICTICVSCNNSYERLTWQIADENSEELEAVLEHFETDSIKHLAAEYVINNMTKHYTQSSPAISEFHQKVLSEGDALGDDKVKRKRQLNSWWDGVQNKDTITVSYDASCIGRDFLIKDIDSATDIWKKSTWKAQVPFDVFCEYILPYRVTDEVLTIGSRDYLRKKYSFLIKGMKDVKTAFSRVHRYLHDSIQTEKLTYQHNFGAMAMEKVRVGNCIQRCIHEIHVMRALGIPVALDEVPFWADYSTKGHNWVSLILPDGAYCLPERDSDKKEPDSIPRRNTFIDSSIFYLDTCMSADYPYDVMIKKHHSKVFRHTFAYNEKISFDSKIGTKTRRFFSEPFRVDVSKDYGCNASVSVKADENTPYAFLCTYHTTEGWKPIAYSENEKGRFFFHNIGDSIVCMIATIHDDVVHPIDYPFIIKENRVTYCKPDYKKRRSVTLNRKYPLIGRFVSNWKAMIGGKFEVSNDSLFKYSKIVGQLNEFPLFRNGILFKDAECQYVRYISPEKQKAAMAEIEVYSDDEILKGSPFGLAVNNPERCFDGNVLTTIDKPHSGYSVGLDLKLKKKVNKVVWYPKNDDNFVLPSHTYELSYFTANGWKSLGVRQATDYFVTFDKVPNGVLLLLEDRAGGKEQRIFTYENGKQIWW